jgi:two-component system nitrogen regulation response regulator GlnG
VAQRKFREDLFYRLNVVRIHLPPLRSRQEDIPQLAEYFLQKIAHQKHRPALKLSEEAARVLESYPWPGNVRELENTIQRASVLATADVLLPKDIPLGQVSVSSSESLANNGDTSIENAISRSSTRRRRILPSNCSWLEREFTLRAAPRPNNQVRWQLLGITVQRCESSSSATVRSGLRRGRRFGLGR